MEFLKINPSQIKIEGDKIKIYAPAQSDFFCNNGAVGEDGITPDTLCNAPFYFREITGDFVMKVKVSHNFQDTYDSASIMVMLDGKNWAKACFEKTDCAYRLNSATTPKSRICPIYRTRNVIY